MLKGSSNYLRNQTLKNLAKAIFCLLLLSGISLFLLFRIFTGAVGFIEEALAVIALAPLVGFFVYLRKYHVYLGGWSGEKHVISLLQSTLSDKYYLINGLHFQDRRGDIDHVVLGPNGIFAIETKNWNGKISCKGDTWKREGKRHATGSGPSEQAKKNAGRVRHVIEGSRRFPFSVRVEPIVVFTNDHAELRITNPTVAILRLQQLPSYIMSYQNQNHSYSREYSAEQLEQIGKEIVQQSK